MDLRVRGPDLPPGVGRKPLSVRLVDGQTSPLQLETSAGGFGLTLSAEGLNESVVAAWLARHAGSSSSAVDPVSPSGTAAVASLSTFVLAVDPRVVDLARLYADVLGAPLCRAADPLEVARAIRGLPDGQSVTLILLSDRLDEALCQSISEANRSRLIEGRQLARYGFLSALTPAHLAWLIVKTTVLLARMPLSAATFANWDVSDARGWARTREAASGAMTLCAIEAPWCDDRVDVMAVRAHGASFDLSLGETVLCCHQDPPLPETYAKRGPTCFHDGVCFRMAAGSSPPTIRILAHQTTPLIWCLDSCATFALHGNAFGAVTYASGLVAGAAVGVIGPFLDIVTSGGLARIYDGILATGGSLGDAVAAACAFEPAMGFDRFLLVGSPDLRLLPPSTTNPTAEMDGNRYRLHGRKQQIWRVRPIDRAEGSLGILGDDGADLWAAAHCDEVPDETGSSSLLITLDAPADLDGWLHVGAVSGSLQALERLASQIAADLAMLRFYPFVDAEDDDLARCQKWTTMLCSSAEDRNRVRARTDAAIALAQLHLGLDALHEKIAARFMDTDVSLDRLPANGFDLEPTERSSDRCAHCDTALYVTKGRWSFDPSHVRHWVQCPNCAGIALAHEDSPLVVQAFTADVVGTKLELAAQLWNRSDEAIKVTLAGQARAGPPESRWEPQRVTLDPKETRIVTVSVSGLEAPGVISYRLLALCGGNVQLHALRRAIDAPSSDPANTARAKVLQP